MIVGTTVKKKVHIMFFSLRNPIFPCYYFSWYISSKI